MMFVVIFSRGEIQAFEIIRAICEILKYKAINLLRISCFFCFGFTDYKKNTPHIDTEECFDYVFADY